MRGWPMSITSTTDARPAMAPMFTMKPSQLERRARLLDRHERPGAGTLSSV